MIGAVAGDIIGSIYEHSPVKSKEFPLFTADSRFTDDTVLTIAVAQAILSGRPYGETIHEFGRRYPRAGYGRSFRRWLKAEQPQPYRSWGNGSAMRVAAVGFAFHTERDVLREARCSAEVTHNHPEGIKGAEATALAILMARQGSTKEQIRTTISQRFDYDLERTLESIRPGYSFDVSCQGSVPEAILSFLESDSYEDAIRNSVSLGGDSDTIACISGGIAEAFYGALPAVIEREAESRLTPDLLTVLHQFNKIYR